MMRKLFMVSSFCVGLAGCGTVSPTTAQQVEGFCTTATSTLYALTSPNVALAPKGQSTLATVTPLVTTWCATGADPHPRSP